MFIDFLKENYRLIIDGIAIIIAIILFIVRKKSLKDISSYIFNYSLLGVLAAEESGLKGKEKLAFAVKVVSDELLKKFPNINVSSYKNLIVCCIEEILTTPQKKED